jgi:hypothetical protein
MQQPPPNQISAVWNMTMQRFHHFVIQTQEQNTTNQLKQKVYTEF